MSSLDWTLNGSGKALIPRRWWPRGTVAGALGIIARSVLCTLWPSGIINKAEFFDGSRVASDEPGTGGVLYDDSVRLTCDTTQRVLRFTSNEEATETEVSMQVVERRVPAQAVWLEDEQEPQSNASQQGLEIEAHCRDALLYLPVMVDALIHGRWRVRELLGGNWITGTTFIGLRRKSTESASASECRCERPPNQAWLCFAKQLMDQIRTLWELPLHVQSEMIHGFLLAGPAGVGKTHAVRQTAQALASQLIGIRAKRKENDLASIRKQLEALGVEICWFLSESKKRRTCARMMVLFDDLDCLCSAGDRQRSMTEPNSIDPAAFLIGTWLDTMQQRLGSDCPALVWIATARDPERIHGTLRRAGRFEWLIHAPAPTAAERASLLEALGAGNPLALAAHTAGYVAADCVQLANQGFSFRTAGSIAARSFQTYCIEHAGEQRALAERQAHDRTAVRRGYAALGGYDQIKQTLFRTLAWPLCYRDTCARLGVRPARAVLLHGPPGCGKTRLVRASVDALQLQGIPFTFVHLSSADLYSAYLGESERTLRDVFAIAHSLHPALIFLDEIDTLVGIRDPATSAGAADVANRLLGTLLTQMDSLADTDAHVVLVGATNRIDRVDPALLRPGRFDVQLEVPLPDEADRMAIIRHFFGRIMDAGRGRLEESTPTAPGSLDLDALVESTRGCSGAEIEQRCFDTVIRDLRPLHDGLLATVRIERT
jgi:SpoVK/Ycf46/Vps4 family AAA+-type ATPase